MRRYFVLMFFGAAAALGLWFGMRGHSVKVSSSSVTALLPRDTLAFVHLPDLNRTRAQFHETDLYKLWREPALQEFLQKPLAQMPKTDTARQKLQELDALEMKDAFFAITAWENNQPKMLGGFRFKGKPEEAEKVIGHWRARAQEKRPEATREVVDYEKHSIDVLSEGTITIASVYDGDWFFAANDVAALKALLDRADKRATDAATTLATDETFTAAFHKIHLQYALFAYGRLDRYFEKLTQSLPANPNLSEQVAMLRQIKSVVAATGIEGGKIRDTLYVTMPKIADVPDLTRSSFSLATAESFLYGASVLNLPKHLDTPVSTAPAARGFSGTMQRLAATFSGSGITLDVWKSAFGSELGIVGDWPANARLPALLATLPVLDAAKANEIIATATAAAGEESTWVTSEEDGVRYYAQPPSNPMVPVAPTIGISNELAVAGLHRNSVAAAIKRSGGSSALAGAPAFKGAEALVPTPKNAFWYVDTALLYSRLDTTLRPMLIMGAAFVPSIAKTVDLAKVPAADVVTKHLSPIVMSQAHDGEGYLAESIGPVPMYGAIIGIAGAAGAGTAFYQRQAGSVAPGAALSPALPRSQAAPSTPALSPTPAATPAPTR